MPKLTTIFAERLRYYRELRCWSQEVLAKRVGLHRQSIVRYEAGKSLFTEGALKRLAEALGVEETDLVDNKIPPEPIVIKPSLFDALDMVNEALSGLRKGKIPPELKDLAEIERRLTEAHQAGSKKDPDKK